jgi:hypothetical protein
LAEIHLPEPANLIVGIIATGRDVIAQGRATLESRFGAIDDESEVIDFRFTDYYQPEMGEGLVRTWLSFRPLRPRDRLAEIKRATSLLEDQFRGADGRRRLNLDPGMLTKHSLVLATTKDYSHRIYLGQGIFAEVALIYEHGRLQPQRWTYPDYQSEATTTFLLRVRARYVEKLRALPS